MIKKLFAFDKLNKISNIALLGILLSLRMILQVVGSFSLGPTTISFTWITLIITGFMFGPFIGLMFGTIADSLGYAIAPSPYMWEYSIQEPLIGLVAGLIGFIYYNYKVNKWVDYGIFQIFLIIFLAISLAVVLKDKTDFKDAIGKSTRESSASFLDNKIIPIILVPIFYVSINTFITVLFLKQKEEYRIFIYISIIVIQAWIIWSWIEGPWAQIRLWKRIKVWNSLNDANRVAITKRWLFNIRVFKASFVVPIEIFVGSSLLIAISKISRHNLGW